MFPTVSQQPLREARSSQKEEYQLANGLRDAANMTSRTRTTSTTAGTGAFTTIWTSDDVPEGAAWAINASVLARGSGTWGRFEKGALFFRDPAGATTQGGATGDIAPVIRSVVTINVQFAVAGNGIAVQVKGDGATTIDWDALVELREVS